MSDEDFNMATGFEEFTAVHHNETDYTAFKEFQAQLQDRFAPLEESRSKKERAKNLQKWDEQFSAPWNQARLPLLKNQEASKKAQVLMKKYPRSSMYLRGPHNTGKTFMALAIARRAIGLGWVTPSQVKHLAEAEMLAITRTGYRMEEKVNELLQREHRLYIIDNVGQKKSYTDQELEMWSRFLEHVSRRGVPVIFTSRRSAQGFSDLLSSSAQAKFANLISSRIITLNEVISAPQLDDEMTEEEEEEQQSLDERFQGLLDFK